MQCVHYFLGSVEHLRFHIRHRLHRALSPTTHTMEQMTHGHIRLDRPGVAGVMDRMSLISAISKPGLAIIHSTHHPPLHQINRALSP